MLNALLDHSVPRRYPHVCEALALYSQADRVTVEIACGGKQYRPYVRGHHIGLDLRTDLYAGPGPELIADARALPLAGGSADILFVVAAMLYIEDWQRVIVEAARVLQPGGRLLIFDYKARVARRMGAPNHFTAGLLRRAIENAGLISEHHTQFLPLRHVGPLRRPLVRRMAAPFIDLLSNWLIVSGRKQ
jgi:SAM-dependent methyltransferase